MQYNKVKFSRTKKILETKQITDISKLFELIEVMRSIDIKSPASKLNEYSMSDNNGGRILF